MGAAALAWYEAPDGKYIQMTEYLSSEGSYWIDHDKWHMEADSFRQAGINTGKKTPGILADFSGYPSVRLKTEMKYFLLYSIKNGLLSVQNVYVHYRAAISQIGEWLGTIQPPESFCGLCVGTEVPDCVGSAEKKRIYQILKRDVAGFITDYYDERDEMEKDVWRAVKIPGARISAAARRGKPSISFINIPAGYRGMVKRFMSRLVIKRSWSYCTEMMIYIRYFFKVFYGHGYGDGFQEALTRKDMEKYLCWVAGDYEGRNATFRSKAVSFIRQYIDYIQLAEYPQAPRKDGNRLLFDDDIPRRERPEDTMGKVKYVPGPVREQLDACIGEIEPSKMMAVYVLLRESGWRGTDVLNLRHGSCLEYQWDSHEQEYVPYLCGEITKTGIPLLKIPIRKEVAEMVKELMEDAGTRSTDENNPEGYLFNTYEGRCKGLPMSKPAFSAAVQSLIERKGIMDGDGKPYHFKAHALRHTRAQEYMEQGMPIGMIQQILGHCSLQMTLHYAKVSENMMYRKWKETEKLELLHLEGSPPVRQAPRSKNEEEVRYEFIRKNLDAVRVPFGVCFKPGKLPCRQQMSHCLECANFCTGKDNLDEYEKEIGRVKGQMSLGVELGRAEWVEKNQRYLEVLEQMVIRIQKEGLVHKNGIHREESSG